MKKIIVSFALLNTLLFVACDTTKNAATVAVPAQTEAEKKGLPPKGMMTEESTAKITPINEVTDRKKQILKKSKMQPMEVGPITIDSLVKH